MHSKEVRPIGVKLEAKNEVRFYTVWVPSGVSLDRVREVLKGDFKITTLRVGDWYPQMIYRCDQMHGWEVTNGLELSSGSVDIVL